MDISSDFFGGNSLLPFFLSPRQDATTFAFAGWSVYSNPPYKAVPDFLRQVERMKKADASSQAVLVAPVSQGHDKEIDGMCASGVWDLVFVFSMSAKNVFSRPGLDNAFNHIRCNFALVKQMIGVFCIAGPAEKRLQWALR